MTYIFADDYSETEVNAIGEYIKKYIHQLCLPQFQNNQEDKVFKLAS